MIDRLRPSSRGASQQIILGAALAFVCVMAFEAVSESVTWDNHYTTDDGSEMISIRRGKDVVKAQIRGDMEWTAADDRIVRMGDDALFDLEVRDAAEGDRRLRATPQADGSPQVLYEVEGKEHPFDAAASQWLQGHMLRLYRVSGVDAEGRVATLLARGGSAAVLAEIDVVKSDYVQGLYFEHLIEQAEFAPEVFVEVIERAGEVIESDHRLGRVMAALDPAQFTTAETRQAFEAMAATVTSDHTLSEALSELLSEPLSVVWADTLLRSAQSIESDHALRLFMAELSQAYPADVALPESYFVVLDGVGSDSEQRRILSVALERHQQHPESFENLLRSFDSLDSTHERSKLLVEIAERQPLTEPLPATYFKIVGALNSDPEIRRSLEASLGRGPLPSATVQGVLESVDGLNSQYEQKRLLWSVLDDQSLDGAQLSLASTLVQRLPSVDDREPLEERLRELRGAASPEPQPAVEGLDDVDSDDVNSGDDGAESASPELEKGIAE